MKLHEQMLDILGEIDADLLPDLNAKPRRTPVSQRILRWSAACAAVALAAGAGLFFGRQQDAPAVLPTTVYAADVVPRYLLDSRAEELLTGDSILTVAPLTGISRQPQIFTAESADDIVLPDNMVFSDRDGKIWRMFSPDSSADDALEKNLRIDLYYANHLRSYGCVVWKIDRETEPARASYCGITPLVSPEETVRRLLEDDPVTTIPETELPDGEITEERIGRRTLVYMTAKHDDFIRIYECFYVRLTDSADCELRWGLYYVPATDEITD